MEYRDSGEMVKYQEVRGVITGIDYFYEEDGTTRQGHYFVQVLDQENPSTFYITNDTFYVDCDLGVGDYVFGYYRADRPMILIYPPRYDIEVVGKVRDGRNVKVDRFNDELVSADGMLKLNISEMTWIANNMGKIYCDNIANKNLLVIYGASTRSIPAITVPSVIIVLPDHET